MEFFEKSKAVKLRSHLDKYLVADDDQIEVRQSRNGSSRRAQWVVEVVEGKERCVRLKSCHGRYLTASVIPFFLGMTGNKAVQADFEPGSQGIHEWEVIRDGFQVRLRSCCGTYLRGNGGTPPWRNSITHDEPYASATQNWILWDVENVKLLDDFDSFSSSVSDDHCAWEPPSPMSIISVQSPMKSSKFQNAKAVRLRSHHDKYLLAEEDEESVTQDRNGSSKNARWVVEPVPGYDFVIRLKSCYGKYLTASNQPLLLGVTGRKVIQTQPGRLDSSIEWEPVKDGSRVKLKTRYGNFLRANGGLPPWRNSVTHDIPYRTVTQDWILWDVDVVEIHVQSPPSQNPSAPPLPHSDSLDLPYTKSLKFSRQESGDSNVSSPRKAEGRIIYYHVAEEDGSVEDEGVQGYSLVFKGNGVEELTRKITEETGLEGIIVCCRSPLNGKLYPLRLDLPPNNVTMQVVLVLPSSTVAREFEEQGLL
ncbi:uncharacterized protein LOC129284355 isoform X2 [Prosopis cineraria]|uniref:uncharacterized protein LOC129284355 isoform X2 n=1 Tax=Prosopis cineraria TaxID=364024 RepID=UPI00240F7638|nr:uncharacterized protein LOC129284355 isoform X2 [Prosopis cineraria]